MSFLDIGSAMMLPFPGKYSATTLMSKQATKNHMHCSKCITTASLHGPLLIAITALRLLLFTKTSHLTTYIPKLQWPTQWGLVPLPL